MPSYTSRDLTVSLLATGEAFAATEEPEADEDKGKCGSCTQCTNKTGNNVATVSDLDLGTLRIHLRSAIG